MAKQGTTSSEGRATSVTSRPSPDSPTVMGSLAYREGLEDEEKNSGACPGAEDGARGRAEETEGHDKV